MTTLRRMGIALAAGLIAGSSPARAQDTTTTHIVSHVEVVPSASQSAARLLRKLREASRKEPGNLRFVVLRRIGQPEHFVILESWIDAKAQNAHAAAAVTPLRDKLKPSLAEPIDERAHRDFAAGVAKVSGVGAVYA